VLAAQNWSSSTLPNKWKEKYNGKFTSGSIRNSLLCVGSHCNKYKYVFWDVAQYSCAEIYYFRGVYYLHHHGKDITHYPDDGGSEHV
jgi:hypothetical protein